MPKSFSNSSLIFQQNKFKRFWHLETGWKDARVREEKKYYLEFLKIKNRLTAVL